MSEELARRAARLAKIRALRERLEAEQRAEQGLGEHDAAFSWPKMGSMITFRRA